MPEQPLDLGQIRTSTVAAATGVGADGESADRRQSVPAGSGGSGSRSVESAASDLVVEAVLSAKASSGRGSACRDEDRGRICPDQQQIPQIADQQQILQIADQQQIPQIVDHSHAAPVDGSGRSPEEREVGSGEAGHHGDGGHAHLGADCHREASSLHNHFDSTAQTTSGEPLVLPPANSKPPLGSSKPFPSVHRPAVPTSNYSLAADVFPLSGGVALGPFVPLSNLKSSSTANPFQVRGGPSGSDDFSAEDARDGGRKPQGASLASRGVGGDGTALPVGPGRKLRMELLHEDDVSFATTRVTQHVATV